MFKKILKNNLQVRLSIFLFFQKILYIFLCNTSMCIVEMRCSNDKVIMFSIDMKNNYKKHKNNNRK